MNSYVDRLVELKQKIKKIKEQEAQIRTEHNHLVDEFIRIENEMMMDEEVLTQVELLELRRAMTIVGEVLTKASVIFGYLRILDEEPEITKGGYKKDNQKKYSIHIESSFVQDYAIGLSYYVTVKTKNESVKAIIRTMFQSSEDKYTSPEERMKQRNSWVIDWDDHMSITLQNTLSKEEYNKQVEEAEVISGW